MTQLLVLTASDNRESDDRDGHCVDTQICIPLLSPERCPPRHCDLNTLTMAELGIELRLLRIEAGEMDEPVLVYSRSVEVLLMNGTLRGASIRRMQIVNQTEQQATVAFGSAHDFGFNPRGLPAPIFVLEKMGSNPFVVDDLYITSKVDRGIAIFQERRRQNLQRNQRIQMPANQNIFLMCGTDRVASIKVYIRDRRAAAARRALDLARSFPLEPAG